MVVDDRVDAGYWGHRGWYKPVWLPLCRTGSTREELTGLTEPCCNTDFRVRRGPVSRVMGIRSVTLSRQVREGVSKEVMGKVRCVRKEVGTGRNVTGLVLRLLT